VADGYYDLGRYADAIQLYEETLSRRQATLGSDHPDTLVCIEHLASAYAEVGRDVEACKLREQVLGLRQVKLGAEHPQTLDSMNNLANSYGQLGRFADALKLHQETLVLRQRLLEPDHPETLKSMNNVAYSLALLERYGEAIELHQQTLARCEATLGPDHAETLNNMSRLAATLLKVDRGAEALPLLDECLRRSVGTRGDPALAPRVMYMRLRYFEKAKDAVGCRTTAEMWEKLQLKDTYSLYRAAAFRAVTAAVLRNSTAAGADKQADAEAERAMTWLQQAVATGCTDANVIKKDQDLAALRDRDDFKALLQRLQGGGQ